MTQAGLPHKRVPVHQASLRDFLAAPDLAGNDPAVDGELGVQGRVTRGRGLHALPTGPGNFSLRKSTSVIIA